MTRSTWRAVPRTRRVAACLAASLVVAGCATRPPDFSPLPTPPAALAPQACVTCLDQSDEVARLRQALAARDAEVRDLRAAQREQARLAAASSRDAARAQARQRRLATQADAASGLAEAEVAEEAARERVPLAPVPALLALARACLDAATTAYARGDYGATLERAQQALTLLASLPAPDKPGTQADTPLAGGIPVRATARTGLRTRPGQGRVIVTVDVRAPLVAEAYRAGYLWVASANGVRGWIAAEQVAMR